MSMKYLLTLSSALALACSSAWAQDDKPAGCLVAHFKGMSLRTNDATQRARLAEEWLRKFIGTCSKEQVAAIKSNSPDWLGTAHTHDVNMIIDASFESMAKGNPSQIAGLYESLAKERKSTTETTSSGVARAPVVQAPVINGGLAGNVNFGNVAGPASNVTTQNAVTNITPIKVPSTTTTN
ncbi:MAG: hypothetical protein EBT49_02625 [Betaproteobacteria bacterium]|jgi:hypothetical protein|nr:hypothetical protein [Betaproteobacteria bacterium]